MTDLDDWISLAALRDYAGEAVYQRGEAYFRDGAVSRLRDQGGKVSARVDGTRGYRVELWTDGEEFGHDCTCPHAAEGNFCKHCVALGLAFLAGRGRGFGPGVSGEAAWGAVCRHLERQPREVLVDWLLDAAQRHNALYHKLLSQARRGA